MRMRPYQQEAGDKVMEALKEHNSCLVVMPTGTGKTVLFADIIRRFRQKDMEEFPEFSPGLALVAAHRSELITQAADKIHRVTKLRCEIEMAEKRVFFDDMFGKCDVIVTTIQTQTAGGDGGGRMSKFDPHHFSLVVIDEGHHGVGASYKRFINYYRSNPNLKIVGVTATPDRADEEALGQVFDVVAFDYEILDAIHDGWLVNIEQEFVNVNGLDFSGVRTTAGDLNGSDLAALMEAEKTLHGIAYPSIQKIGDKRAIAFTASVKQAEMLSEIFNRHREGMAAWICGKTDKVERQTILRNFSLGKIQVVVNCGVLTEGFDDSGVEYIIMGRPTKSRSLYAQMAGRAIRPHDSIAHTLNDCATATERLALIASSPKPVCKVIDFVGNSGKHKLMTTADILGGNFTEEVLEIAVNNVKKSGNAMRMSEAIEEAEEQAKTEREERRRLDEARRMRLVAKASFSTTAVSPFDVFQIHPQAERGWDRGKVLSEKQANLLRKQGIDPDKIPYSQARQLCGEICKRFEEKKCSFKQAVWLKKYGHSTDVSMADAKVILDGIFGGSKKTVSSDRGMAFRRMAG